MEQSGSMQPESAIKIQLIEDDPSVRKAICRLLESSGYQVNAYSSAEGYLEEKSEVRSCLILDIHLGSMNGLQLQEYLIQSGAKIPIVFISSYDEEDIHWRAQQTSTPFLRKPIQRDQLIEAIEKAVNSFHD